MDEHGTIEERLEKLERQNRRMKLAGVGALVIAGAVVLMGQASGPRTLPEVRANSFVLVDANGQRRAMLAMFSDGPGLAPYDPTGQPRAELTVFSSGPDLQMEDANGKVRVGPTVFLGKPELVLIGANEKAEADLFVDSIAPALTFSDTNGSQRVALGVASDGPWFSLNDASGFKTDIGVTHLVSPETGEVRRTSAASIALFGKDKNVLWSAPPQN